MLNNSPKHFEKYKSVVSQHMAQPSFWFERKCECAWNSTVILIYNNVFRGNLCVLSYKCFKDSKEKWYSDDCSDQGRLLWINSLAYEDWYDLAKQREQRWLPEVQ